MKRLLALVLVCLLIFACASAVAEVPWTFAVSLTELTSDHSILANRDHLLASDYEPGDLVNITVKKVSSTPIQLRQEASAALEAMFEDSKLVTEYTYKVQKSNGSWSEKTFQSEGGLRLVAKSGYRSYGKQNTMYKNRLDQIGYDDGYVMVPGGSEHQTGYSVDVLSVDYNANNSKMNSSFYQTPEAQWMEANCYTYGFIIRYPEADEEITGVPYEPWHLRYVGREIAGYIKINDCTLEEFTERWQAALADFEAAGGNVEQQVLMEATAKPEGMESTILDLYGEDGDSEVSLTF